MRIIDKNWGRKNRIGSLLILFVLFLVFTQSIYSDSSNNRDIVIVFDASGSMFGLTSTGETKIDAAKDAVNNFLKELTSNDRVALVVFYDCEDIHVEAGLTYDHSSISSSVNSIEQQGGTPVGDSLLYAWDYLKSYGNTNHSWYIIIFTDGGETCMYDPCEAARKIASESSYYRQTPVYTIGFLIEPGSQTEEDLKCIAETTGGEYFPADSPEELKKAFEEIVDVTDAITVNEVIVYSVASTAILGTLLVTRSLLHKNARGSEEKSRLYEFDIAISFAGEDRKIAENLARKLRNKDIKVFYDRFYKERLWGKKLTTYFQDAYGPKTRFVVPLISKYYPIKDWTDFEFSIMRKEAKKRETEFILPLRLDDTKMLGIHEDIGYLDYRKEGIDGIVDCFSKKLSHLQK